MGDEKIIGGGIDDGDNLVNETNSEMIHKEQKQHTEEHHSSHCGEHHHDHHHSEHHGEHSAHHHGEHHRSEHHHGDHHHSSHHSDHSHGGHSHHHSGSHHHSHRRKRRSSGKQGLFSKFKKLFNTTAKKNKISIVCALALVVILLFSVTLDVVDFVLSRPNGDQSVDSTNDTGTDMLNVELINITNGVGTLVNDSVVSYMKVNLIDNPDIIIRNFASSGERVDEQKPIAIKLSTDGTRAYAYKIELANNAQFTDSYVDYLDGANGTYTFEHLYVNTAYYYRVTAYTAKGEIVKDGQFRTADTPRILSIDGLYNVRDIGNWRTTDSGKRIKQGLLIRGTELDGAVESIYHVSDEGIADMLEIYGIKFDMDLRNEVATPLGKDALGANVEHKYYASPAYYEIFTEDGKAIVKSIFKDLANPNNYPMYLHCTYGADRTGTICYLLEAVLGVSRGDCLKEYGLTGRSLEDILVVEAGLKEYDESGTMTLKEQAEAYLISCGITMSEINTIREIFLGE